MSSFEGLTPGIHKFIHHLDHINNIVTSQVVAPLHVSIWPTIRCQLQCSYCCCRNIDNRKEGELDIHDFRKTVSILSKYGTKAIEFSGGGEPLLWSYLDEGSKCVNEHNIKLSMITNGILLNNVKNDILKRFNWIRVSLQSYEHANSIDYIKIKSLVKISGSYIYSEMSDLSIIEKLYNIAKDNDIIIRIAISQPNTIEFQNIVSKEVSKYSDRLFFSKKEQGPSLGCYMPWIRAAIDWRGNFLPCPSIQLNNTNEGYIPDNYVLCKMIDIEDWLINNRPRDMGFRCNFCNCGKEHNDFIHSILKEVDDVEFV
jgi:organic radical activating enzyme